MREVLIALVTMLVLGGGTLLAGAPPGAVEGGTS